MAKKAETPEVETEQDGTLSLSEVKQQPVDLYKHAEVGVVGDWNDEDIVLPYLSLCQKSGQLSDSFTPGRFIFNKEVDLGESITFIVLQMKKAYEEDLPEGDDSIPRQFDTAQAAQAAGFKVGIEYDRPRVREFADLFIALEVPEEHGQFTYVDGSGNAHHYTRAMWRVRSTAFGLVAKRIRTATIGGHLSTGLWKGSWESVSTKRTNKQHTWFVPTTKSQGVLTPEHIDFVESNLLME